MRVLLEECLPRRLKRELAGHHVRTAPEMGWASKRNGELLQLAQREFDVFLQVAPLPDRCAAILDIQLGDQREPSYDCYAGMRRSACALPQTIFWKIAGDVERFSRLNVSRATHLPLIRGAAALS